METVFKHRFFSLTEREEEILSKIVEEANRLYDESETAVKSDTSPMVSFSDFLAERQRVMEFLAVRPGQFSLPIPLP